MQIGARRADIDRFGAVPLKGKLWKPKLIASGDKFDDRANEKTCFTAKDRDLIEERKVELQKLKAIRREEQILSCPRCPGKLGSFSFMEFVLDRCESCDRIWLYKGKLEGLLRSAARGPLGVLFYRCFSLR